MKNAVDGLSIDDMGAKAQGLGEKLLALNETSKVSISTLERLSLMFYSSNLHLSIGFSYARRQKSVTSALKSLSYHARSIWLFTFSDLKTIVGPETAFGILSALSGPILTANRSSDIAVILGRIPIVAFWCWINLLPFAIDNQRQPEAIEEDGVNKPWRPMPSGRLSEKQAKWLMWSLYPAAILASMRLGGLKQCLTLIFLGWWYNDLGGADYSFITRNFINACGFLSYASGATEVASRSGLLGNPFNPAAWPWFIIIGAVVFTSVHTQDMYDQAGDGARGRKTVPLVIGDAYARWSIAVAMAVWSVACPTFWQLGPCTHAMSMITAGIVAFRSLTKRSVSADQLTFRIWNLWMVMLYLMPLFRRIKGDSWL